MLRLCDHGGQNETDGYCCQRAHSERVRTILGNSIYAYERITFTSMQMPHRPRSRLRCIRPCCSSRPRGRTPACSRESPTSTRGPSKRSSASSASERHLIRTFPMGSNWGRIISITCLCSCHAPSVVVGAAQLRKPEVEAGLGAVQVVLQAHGLVRALVAHKTLFRNKV